MVDVSTKYMGSKQKYRVQFFLNILTNFMLLKDKDYNTNFPR
jgi:hypothetical protein